MEGGYLSNFQNPSLDILGYLFENSFLYWEYAGSVKQSQAQGLACGLKMFQYSVDATGAWELN